MPLLAQPIVIDGVEFTHAVSAPAHRPPHASGLYGWMDQHGVVFTSWAHDIADSIDLDLYPFYGRREADEAFAIHVSALPVSIREFLEAHAERLDVRSWYAGVVECAANLVESDAWPFWVELTEPAAAPPVGRAIVGPLHRSLQREVRDIAAGRQVVALDIWLGERFRR